MKRSSRLTCRCRVLSLTIGAFVFSHTVDIDQALAKPEFREAFFTVYPNAVGTVIETVPSQPNHCGVCHWKFTGGGQRNPHGVAVENALAQFPNDPQGYQDAIWSIRNDDPDGDGFSTLVEVTDVFNFTNTPTFPGLTPGNVGNVSQVDIAEIQDYLVPSSGGDSTPPDVTVIAPNGGEILTGNTATTVEWTATDESGVSGINLFISLDGGVTYKPVALGISNTGSHVWFPANRPTPNAIFLVEAVDNAFNYGGDVSDAPFTIDPPPGGLVPTTLRDFDMPGSQPFDAGILNPPEACAVCHGNYDNAVEPYYNWQGSMMAQASLDPLFEAAMAIANQDAPDSGDLCLRCHISRGWLQGRSIPTDGTQMLDSDKVGLTCDLCHRMVDPIASASNPAEDTAILAALDLVPQNFGLGMYVIDPTGARRGPFADADSGHPILVSPFHREAAFCGTCHNVSNPAFEKDGNGDYLPNDFDAPATNFSANVIAPVERTYSEWFHSEYNSPTGVFAPEFGGNRDYVSTCQDCHMRDVTGQGCNATPPIRSDLPLHDMTGGSTWLPGLLSALYPGEINDAAMQAGIVRAQYMLQNAAELAVVQNGPQLEVTVTNNTGHKLPTGYPEGRRIWINVKFYGGAMQQVGESGAYDSSTGVLSHDPEAKIYEILPVTSGVPGVPDGTEFHFVLNNAVLKDNRIPPRGFTNAAFADFGGPPVAYSYADGQYWDDTIYTIPPTATSAEVTLYYQSTSKEFVEFLDAANSTNAKGQEMYDLWNNNGKCPPELMATVTLALQSCSIDADCDDTLYCNGLEGCLSGFCAPGTDPCPGQGCDESTDTCFPLGCNDNGLCESWEDCITCPNDCFSGPGGTCGDGICAGSGEDCFTCPADCRCTGGGCSNGCCGDGICSGENTSNCPVDCDPGFIPPTPTCCGDGTCEGTEDETNCAVDCSAGCTSDTECDDGLYCNGVETCDAGGVCQPGTPVVCDDGFACTADSCNEVTDTCDVIPNDAFCDNGQFCDGAETCVPTDPGAASDGCLAGTAPDCTDAYACTDDACDPAANGGAGACVNTPDDTFCDNSQFCDGDETCVPGDPGAGADGCLAGADPCPNTNCDEVNDVCTGCLNDADCDDGQFCNGVETCDTGNGVCIPGTEPDCDDNDLCTTDSCDQELDECVNEIVDTDGDGVCDAEDICPGGDDTIDDNNNGIPDACEVNAPLPAAAPHDILKNRYVSIDALTPNPTLSAFNIKATLTATLVNGVTAIGSEWWAGQPDAACISIMSPIRPAAPPDWTGCGTIHLTSCGFIPTSTYDIVVVDGTTESGALSADTQALPGSNKWFGDVVGSFDPVADQWSPPDSLVTINDAVAAIKTFQDPSRVGPGCGNPPCNATHTSVTDVHPAGFPLQPWGLPNKLVDINDVFTIILGFQGREFPGPQLQSCP